MYHINIIDKSVQTNERWTRKSAPKTYFSKNMQSSITFLVFIDILPMNKI